jgi:myo-inositol-1-phosphate synthase
MRTGVWFIGARGSVAVTATVGALALRARLAPPIGCVTELPDLRGAALPGWDDLVVGGHDVVTTPLLKRADELAAAGVLPAGAVAALTEDLVAVEDELRPLPVARTQAGTAASIAADLARFRRRRGLDSVVVVNVATTEPAPPPHPAHADLRALETAMALPGPVLPPSALAAYAAFTAGCPFVDFTPSTGARLPALDRLARERGVPYAGNDGKTGETLLKSVLAPMFALRNLRVRSWSGLNLLGGGDGAALADPGANAAKVASKQRVLRDVLGYQPEGTSRIDYVEEIGDFKTAWDLVTFAGFLGTGMRLEITWHGCDSALAAPLVLDLARLTAAAHRAGRVGPLTQLGFFFKDPLGTGPAALGGQWTELVEFAAGLSDVEGPCG